MFRRPTPYVLATVAVCCLTTHGMAQETAAPPSEREGYLRWTTYITAGSVERLAREPGELEEAIGRLKDLRITKAYLEVSRGNAVDPKALTTVRDGLRNAGFTVAGGIATVPGEGFAVRQEGPLDWLNWQNPKTQEDIRGVVRTAAGLFDEFIVDDFFCTGDVSAESQAARDGRSWPEYRRALLAGLARTVIIDPARSVNPNIALIVKFPQWYDRFHEFGYDVDRESALFDKVWVGTETRGASTQRFGFVQPYEGFVNYRWIASVAGAKTSGAWFDHGDCDAEDFIDQAYQSVLAGAPEIVLFSYAAIQEGHPGHDRLKREQARLEALAESVQASPVAGVAAYKPVNSDAHGDLFVMDYIGMLGIPVVPVAHFPSDAPVLFLPAQAASDPQIVLDVKAAVARQATIVMTASFLSALAETGEEMARIAGIESPVISTPMPAESILVRGEELPLKRPLDLESNLSLRDAAPVLLAKVAGRQVPFLTAINIQGARVFVLNTHTFSQIDYDAAGEVLLAPRLLGLLDLPRAVANVLRTAFNAPLGFAFDAPPRVTLQPLGDGSMFIQNYALEPQEVRLTIRLPGTVRFVDRLGGNPVVLRDNQARLVLDARSRAWLKPES